MSPRSLAMAILLFLLTLSGLIRPVHAQEDVPCAPDSGVVITRQMTSEAIGQEKSYTLYLPPNWCDRKGLPLLVMLHGLRGDHTDWVDQGHIDDIATEMILAGKIKPLVILMPDADDSFYINGSKGDYETYIVSELLGEVDRDFPTAATRQTRSIGGFSMGGYGALYLGLRYPDVFSAIGAHSPALIEPGPYPISDYLFGENNELVAEHDPISLIREGGWPEHTRLFVDIGNADNLLGGVLRLSNALYDHAHIQDFQGHVWPGRHEWRYWNAHIADYLRFYAGPNTALGR